MSENGKCIASVDIFTFSSQFGIEDFKCVYEKISVFVFEISSVVISVI